MDCYDFAVDNDLLDEPCAKRPVARHTYPGMIYAGGHSMYVSGPGPRHPNAYAPAALVDDLVDTLIACRDNYGKYGGLVNDPNAPGALIDKIQNALEEAGVGE